MKTTITMPQSFFCREHRAIPARGMGPSYCWRCIIRQDLWEHNALVGQEDPYPAGPAPEPIEAILLDGRPSPGPFASPVPSGKSPGSLANLVPRWHRFVLDHSLTEGDFSAACPDDSAHGNWSVITFWRAKVHLLSPT